MNREEILRAAQAQGEKEGEYERNIQNKSVLFGAALALFAIVIMGIVEYFVFKNYDYGKPAILLLLVSASDLFCGIKTKTKKLIVAGLILLVLCLGLFGLYIGALLK